MKTTEKQPQIIASAIFVWVARALLLTVTAVTGPYLVAALWIHPFVENRWILTAIFVLAILGLMATARKKA